jgi:hypothetical protein
MSRNCGLVLLLTTFSLCPATAKAQLLYGADIQFDVRDPDLQTVTFRSDFLVNNSTELSITNQVPVVPVNVAVFDTSVTLTYPNAAVFNTGAFNGYVITDLTHSTGVLENLLIDPATTLPGLDSSRVSFDPNDIFINVSALTVTAPNEVIKLDLVGVPEPGSALLTSLGGAAALLGYGWRRARGWIASRGEQACAAVGNGRLPAL